MCRWLVYKGAPVSVTDLLLRPKRNLKWFADRDVQCLPHLPFSRTNCSRSEPSSPSSICSTGSRRPLSFRSDSFSSQDSCDPHDTTGCCELTVEQERLSSKKCNDPSQPESLHPVASSESLTDLATLSPSDSEDIGSPRSSFSGPRQRTYSFVSTLSNMQRNHLKNKDGYGIAWYAHQSSNQGQSTNPESQERESIDSSAPEETVATRKGFFRRRSRVRQRGSMSRCLSPSIHKRSTSICSDTEGLEKLVGERSSCICAHVRAASKGLAIQDDNCHPFTCGKFIWMHNGCISYFACIRESLLAGISDRARAVIRGTTDSEVAFAVFLDHFDNYEESHSTADIMKAVRSTIKKIVKATGQFGDAASSLNFCVTDGKSVVCSRFRNSVQQQAPSLYWIDEVELQAGPESTTPPILKKRLYKSDADAGPPTVVIASEPVATDEPQQWQLVPNNTIIAIDEDHSVTIEPIPFIGRNAHCMLRKWACRAMQRLHQRSNCSFAPTVSVTTTVSISTKGSQRKCPTSPTYSSRDLLVKKHVPITTAATTATATLSTEKAAGYRLLQLSVSSSYSPTNGTGPVLCTSTSSSCILEPGEDVFKGF